MTYFAYLLSHYVHRGELTQPDVQEGDSGIDLQCPACTYPSRSRRVGPRAELGDLGSPLAGDKGAMVRQARYEHGVEEVLRGQ